MLLQAWYALCCGQPGRWLNLLALFFACAGAWLLLVTRLREQSSVASLPMDRDGHLIAASQTTVVQRLNRFFYQFGLSCLLGALLLSWYSTQL